ncbi:MAG: leucyl aminopeptidase [Saprospiraceae bacterium]|nr:leucyl aminopeptidase [Saprospiraceae bacterium]
MKILQAAIQAASYPQTLIIPVAAPAMDEGLPESFFAALSDAFGIPRLSESDFKADGGEMLLFFTPQTRVIVLGLGKNPAFADVVKYFRSVSYKHKQKLSKAVGVSLLHQQLPENPAAWLEAAANGLALGTYQIGRHKTGNGEAHPLSDPEATLHLYLPDNLREPGLAAAHRGLEIAGIQQRVFNMVNAPANKKTPADLAAWAQASAKQYGYKATVYDHKQSEELGFHALLAVGRGSEHPPFFIVLEYAPANPVKKVALVGKGVTFDTGGISIKPSSNLHYMKSDMGGAGAVLGAMEAAAALRLPIHLTGVILAAENSIDALALRPSDVIGSYSGKTIEIIDTDAEGRLILADGLTYVVRNHQPDVVIDLATLTGSVVRTLGYHAAGIFSNNEVLSKQLCGAGDLVGERLWPLPLWDVYKEDIKSDIADLRNFSGKQVAGAISAAKFLEVFVEEHPAWAHLDIAGVAFSDTEFASQKAATAYGVRLLLAYLEMLSKS